MTFRWRFCIILILYWVYFSILDEIFKHSTTFVYCSIVMVNWGRVSWHIIGIINIFWNNYIILRICRSIFWIITQRVWIIYVHIKNGDDSFIFRSYRLRVRKMIHTVRLVIKCTILVYDIGFLHLNKKVQNDCWKYESWKLDSCCIIILKRPAMQKLTIQLTSNDCLLFWAKFSRT